MRKIGEFKWLARNRYKKKCFLSAVTFFCLFVCCLMSDLRIFRTHGDVIIADESHFLNLRQPPVAFQRRGNMKMPHLLWHEAPVPLTTSNGYRRLVLTCNTLVYMHVSILLTSNEIVDTHNYIIIRKCPKSNPQLFSVFFINERQFIISSPTLRVR